MMAKLRSISSAVLVAEDPGNAPLLPSLEAQISSLSQQWSTCRSPSNLLLVRQAEMGSLTCHIRSFVSQGGMFQCRSMQTA